MSEMIIANQAYPFLASSLQTILPTTSKPTNHHSRPRTPSFPPLDPGPPPHRVLPPSPPPSVSCCLASRGPRASGGSARSSCGSCSRTCRRSRGWGSGGVGVLAGEEDVGDGRGRRTMANSIRESMVADQWGPRLAYLKIVSL